jgi:hypothetical protein
MCTLKGQAKITNRERMREIETPKKAYSITGDCNLGYMH